MTQTTWEGVYLDGRTATRHPAAINPKPDGLQVITQGGMSLWWPYDEIRQTQGTYAGEQVRLERGGDCPELIVISDPGFLTALHELAPGFTLHFHNPAERSRRVKLTFLAALASLGLGVFLYRFGLPLLAVLITHLIPISWDQQLGNAVIEQLAPPQERCTDPDLLRVLDNMTSQLTATQAENPYDFHVIVIDAPMVNAFAVPGGYVVFFRGLLQQTRTPDELAGVLAHEVQHILQRHTTRTIVQEASTGVLVAALFGDPSAVAAFGLNAARLLGRLGYSRRHEEEADTEGMRMILAAGIEPAGMINFFRQLLEQGHDPSDFGAYWTTHPPTQERIERLTRLVEQSSGELRGRSAQRFSYLDWDATKMVCHAADRRP